LSFENERSDLPALTSTSLLVVPKVDPPEDPGIVDVVCNLMPGGVVQRHSRCRGRDLEAILAIHALENSAGRASCPGVC